MVLLGRPILAMGAKVKSMLDYRQLDLPKSLGKKNEDEASYTDKFTRGRIGTIGGICRKTPVLGEGMHGKRRECGPSMC